VKAAGSVYLQIIRVNGLHYASGWVDLEKYCRKAKQNPCLNCLPDRQFFTYKEFIQKLSLNSSAISYNI